jgi:D-amino peptidase
MNVYIAADMEGIGGILLKDQLTRGAPLYEEARRLLTAEVNAAVAGAFEGGATGVVVKDAHGSGYNLLMDEVDPRADIVAGPSFPERFAGLDGSFIGVILLGYHAMAGTPAAVCAHTMSSVSWERYELCGREVGEVGIDAALAGTYGVPVIMVSGDDKVCAEARALLGDAVVTCEVKRGLNRHGAVMKAPSAARAMVREAVVKAVSAEPRPPVYVPLPYYEACLTYVEAAMAEERLKTVDAQRLDDRTLLFRGDDLREVIHRSLG